MAQLSKENSLQKEAFELYYHMGDKRSLMVERIGVEANAYQKALSQELRRLSLLPIININTSKDSPCAGGK